MGPFTENFCAPSVLVQRRPEHSQECWSRKWQMGLAWHSSVGRLVDRRLHAGCMFLGHERCMTEVDTAA